MEDFLLGFVADGTGVVKDEASVGFVLDAGVALLLEGADDFFGVMGVHLAAEGFDVEGLAHTSSIAAGTANSTALAGWCDVTCSIVSLALRLSRVNRRGVGRRGSTLSAGLPDSHPLWNWSFACFAAI